MTSAESRHVEGKLRSTSRADSFRHAFAGCWYMLRSQQNAWIHAAFTILAIGLGVWLRIAPVAWAAVVLAGGLVWTAEAFNTALEAAVDVSTTEFHPLAKAGKDVAAAGVLIAALSAVLVGLFIFGPPLLAKLEVMIQSL